MDREIPKEEIKKRRKKRIIRAAAIVLIIFTCFIGVEKWLGQSVNRADLTFSTVDRGTIEVSVNASGKVVPIFEEIINSPINSRIIETYKKSGDAVDAGTPILKLDLQSAETDYKKGQDDEQMRISKLQQLKVDQNTKLTDLAMQIRVAQMKLNRMRVEMHSERYLDSIGASTRDNVHQKEMNYNVARIELEQQKKQLINERLSSAAEYKVQKLDLDMFIKSLGEIKRTLEDAKIRAPRKAILTYINNQIGSQITQGEQVAVVSDLSHFKITGEIADSYGDKISVGGKAIVKIGGKTINGTISSVTPLSKNGVINFTVQLKDDHNSILRSGLNTDIYVINSVKSDVMRIANSAYYTGPGTYSLFVANSNGEIVKRKVKLGEAGFDYVEVLSGLKPGDKVVVSDMNDYKDKNKLKLKN
ncbi:efflux RND transporter periplasmic adaptor subunit [Prevotella sp.]|uniref:efflux RND transporter periplasmic adaptor subunit n=1 Tax=Prevotella sp. TaxID=59823 RepID=UPI00264805BC|nr:HlyD family efflux transporter periplasmic adaptor subunit [Prevotella sp.]MDN5554590.1 HlyD family efflux transporter periplasmic adaptor subunit [Prevotella sp.]